MHCPFCAADETKVIDSRLADEGSRVRRRRECLVCSERFTTFESAELAMPRVVKGQGEREAFNINKLRLGLERACHKRPVSVDQMETALDQIQRRLRAMGEREVPSSVIGQLVMDALKDLDQVAFVRFASVYRRFEDVAAFAEAIETLREEGDAEAQKLQLKLLPK